MSDYTVTLTISEQAYTRARRIAESAAQPVERVLASRLEEVFDDLSGLPPDERTELAAFRQLSDDTLRGITREQMTRQEKERMVYLGDKTSPGYHHPGGEQRVRAAGRTWRPPDAAQGLGSGCLDGSGS
jgi:hypothetical protein